MERQSKPTEHSTPSPGSSCAAPAGKRAVVYARVSSDRQREDGTIRAQLESLPRFVEAQGWQLVRPSDAYVDDGVSGASGRDQRDGLRRLLDDAARDEFDVVVCFGLDRLTRSESWVERAEVLGTLQDARVEIANARTGGLIDLDTERGDLDACLEAYYGARERRTILARMASGWDRAVREGHKPSGQDPYGLRYDRETRDLVIDAAEAEVVRQIYARALDGHGCMATARELNAAGVPVRERRKGAVEWSRTQVWKILKNPLYRGEWLVNKRKGAVISVPAIVDDVTWYEAQARLSERRKTAPRPSRRKIPALAMGRARCALCGGTVGVTSSTKRGKVLSYYACRRRFRATGGERCKAPYRRVEEIDAELWSLLEGYLATGWQGLAERMKAEAGQDDTEPAAELERIDARLAHLAAAGRKTMALYRRQLIDELTLEAELKAGNAERADLQARRARIVAEHEQARSWTPAELEATVESVRARLAGATPEKRQAIAWALIPGHGPYVVTIGPGPVQAVACLDVRLCSVLPSTCKTEHLADLPPLALALAC